MHLPAKTDAADVFLLVLRDQLFQSFHALVEPVLRILFRPARMREEQRVFLGNNVPDVSLLVHQQQLDSRSAEINTDIQHFYSPPNMTLHGSVTMAAFVAPVTGGALVTAETMH